MADDKKGITVKIDADLHAEIKEYLERHEGMTMAEFITLVGETADWVDGENTGVLTKQEYAEFINELVKADKNGTYLYSKPYYIYKGIKK